jgi:GTP cyclohydrolase I
VTTLPDIQSQTDDRGVVIDKVGISGLRYPVSFDDDRLTQSGIADFEVTVELPADRRGTHMSRMVQAVQTNFQTVNPHAFPALLKATVDLLEVKVAAVSLMMPLAVRVRAPSSGQEGCQVHDLHLRGRHCADAFLLETTVSSDVTTLCPCSKAISDYGAHNQRTRVSLTICGDGDTPYPLDVSTMIDLIRENCSHPVFPVVKRSDERALTMAAYDNPMFVEDLIRQLSLKCRAQNITHRVELRTLESIHSHDAVAKTQWESI